MIASLASLAGGKIEPAAAPDSRDFSKLLTGKGKKGRKYLIEHNQGNTLSVITDKNLKYIAPSNQPDYNSYTNTELGNAPIDQLYNLNNDAGEKNNLAFQKPSTTKKLKKTLEREKQKGYLQK